MREPLLINHKHDDGHKDHENPENEGEQDEDECVAKKDAVKGRDKITKPKKE